MNNKRKYFIYVRKSTGSDERQVRSIGDQLAELRELIRKEGLDVGDMFAESQSAMSKGRPIFNQMLDRIEAGEANGILAWHPDRLARNAFDGGRIIDMLDEKKIDDLKFSSFWFENTAQGKMMLNLAFGQSKYYSDSLSVNIRRGQRQKTSEGIWGWKAPIGYLNEPKLRTIVVDPEMGPLVRQTFELYATGKYPFVDLREIMSAKRLQRGNGSMLTLSRYQYMLKNSFYYGVFHLNGEIHQGSHKPLITKELFDACQAVMRRRSKANTIRSKSYVYRSLLRCGECGCFITMETQKGHNYLRCTKRVKRDCSQPYLREEKLTERIAAVLDSVSLPDETADWMVNQINSERAEGTKVIKAAEKAATKQIDALDSQLDRLTAAYLESGAFSPADFRKHKEELVNSKRGFLDKVEALHRDDISRFEPMVRFINRSKQMKYVASHHKPNELRAELENIGSNLTLLNRELKLSPRGAWKTVVNQGLSTPQQKTATPSVAVPAGYSSFFIGEWSQRDASRTPNRVSERISKAPCQNDGHS
jgi:site-specific DNA recombinase